MIAVYDLLGIVLIAILIAAILYYGHSKEFSIFLIGTIIFFYFLVPRIMFSFISMNSNPIYKIVLVAISFIVFIITLKNGLLASD